MKRQKIQPSDIINSLNRSQQTMREASWLSSREAAGKQYEFCKEWLKDRRIPHYQDDKGNWVLG